MSVALLLSGIASSSLCDAAVAKEEPGAGFDVTSYKLALTPDIKNKTVVGRETVAFRPTVDGLQRLSFSGNALSIDRATLNGVAVAHTLRGDILHFDLPRPLARGRTARLALSYHGRPARGFAGTATMLYTSYFACDWMICAQNAFGDKAAFSIDLQVPRDMTTLSAGSMIATRPGPDGSEIHSWKSATPILSLSFRLRDRAVRSRQPHRRTGKINLS